ncbi:J domain-containing protein [Rubrolithibacter danxiaensis]|uniref:J domain-containing protein n=1 Tax=Rubrolithibacter danxiaensis TaxID=3390805 RepID=UPI003BF7B08E
MRNYYSILGIDSSATAEEIKAAFRKLSKKYHPDLNQDNLQAEEHFKNIQEAYYTLKSPLKRREFDDRLGRHNQQKTSYKTAGNFTVPYQKIHTHSQTHRKGSKKSRKSKDNLINRYIIAAGVFLFIVTAIIISRLENSMAPVEDHSDFNYEKETVIDTLDLIEGYKGDSIFLNPLQKGEDATK